MGRARRRRGLVSCRIFERFPKHALRRQGCLTPAALPVACQGSRGVDGRSGFARAAQVSQSVGRSAKRNVCVGVRRVETGFVRFVAMFIVVLA